MNEYFMARHTCPACNSAASTTLFANSYTASPIAEYIKTFYGRTGPGVEFEYLDGAQFVLKECSACGLIYQYEIPGPLLMARLYERWLDPQIVRAMVSNARSPRFYLWCAAEITRVLNFLNRPLGDIRFLDFGMGWGNWCLMAKGFGCDVYGTELSDTRSEYALQMGIKVVEWAQLPEHRFDFINAEQVFEHLADPSETLRHLRRALTPNGVIRVCVPGRNDIKQRLAIGDWLAPPDSHRSLNDVAPLQHINCFGFDALVAMARGAGLEEVNIHNDFLQPATAGGRLQAALRPYVRALLPQLHEMRRRRSTNLCFRAVGEVAVAPEKLAPAPQPRAA